MIASKLNMGAEAGKGHVNSANMAACHRLDTLAARKWCSRLPLRFTVGHVDTAPTMRTLNSRPAGKCLNMRRLQYHLCCQEAEVWIVRTLVKLRLEDIGIG